MKFGVFIMPQHPRTDSSVYRFHQSIQQTVLARDAGFDAIAMGQHFLSPPYQSLQSIPLLARLAAEAGSMELCLSILLLAVLNPVQVAEEVASLDVICEGRVNLGIGLGYRPIEYDAFGVPRKNGVGRMLESLELIKRLWAEERVTFKGKFFSLSDATCTIRPVQKPHPPIWFAGNADAAVARAARLGYPWIINPHAALPTIERQWRFYKETLTAAGHPLPKTRPISLELHVAPTREEATQVAQPFLAAKYQAYADWGQDKVLPGDESFRIAFADLARDRFLLGSPQDIIEEIEKRVERLESNYFLFRVGWPGMENYKVLRVIELMGEHVLPYFRKKDGNSPER